MILLAELVRARERDRTDAYIAIEKKSQFRWDIKFPSVNKPNTKAVRL